MLGPSKPILGSPSGLVSCGNFDLDHSLRFKISKRFWTTRV